VSDFNPYAVNSQHLSDSKSFTVTVNPLARVILTPISATGGQFQMQVSGTVGPDYTIQAGTTLTNWTALATTNPAATPFRFTDTNTATNRYRFYRVLLGP
jgi:hypothetical protein